MEWSEYLSGLAASVDTGVRQWAIVGDNFGDDAWKSAVRSAFTEWVSRQRDKVPFGRFSGSAAELAFVREHVDGKMRRW